MDEDVNRFILTRLDESPQQFANESTIYNDQKRGLVGLFREFNGHISIIELPFCDAFFDKAFYGRAEEALSGYDEG